MNPYDPHASIGVLNNFALKQKRNSETVLAIGLGIGAALALWAATKDGIVLDETQSERRLPSSEGCFARLRSNKSMQLPGAYVSKEVIDLCAPGRNITAQTRGRLDSSRPQLMDDSVRWPS